MKPTTHTCHAATCNRAIPPKLFMCARHWRLVPKELQDLVWATYRPGQEIDKRPSSDYLVVHQISVAAVAFKEGHDDAANQAIMNARGFAATGGPKSAKLLALIDSALSPVSESN